MVFQKLVDDILGGKSDQNTHYEIAFINSSSNGIHQISGILEKQTNEDKTYNAVHLVTHGSDATLNLGNAQVNGANLDSYSQEFASWQSAFADDADFLIYGCEVAGSDDGEAFVSKLAALTGADVAASDDVTGHESLEGDWSFEFAVGVVDAEIAFSDELQSSWMHSLAGEETVGESGGATGRSVAVNSNQTVVQVFSQDASTGNGLDVFYRVTDASTGTQAAILVTDSIDSAADQYWASVAMADNGNFVVVWTGDVGVSGQEVFAKYYAADGSVIRDQFQISENLSGGNDASVAMDQNGNFVVAWEGNGALDANGIYAQQFDNSGAAINPIFLVNDVVDAGIHQGNADAAMNDSGQFVIAWDTYTADNVDSRIYAQLFQSTGVAIGAANTLVDMDPGRVYSDASVSINESGNFVVAYTSDSNSNNKILTGNTFVDIGVQQNIDLGAAVNAATYSFDGTNITFLNSFFVNETVLGDQANPSVSLLDNDVLTVVWEGEGNADNPLSVDTFDAEGVFKRQFNLSGSALSPEEFVEPGKLDGKQGSAAVTSNGTEAVISFDDGADSLALDLSFNYAPTSSNTTITVASGYHHTFSLSDFGYFDANGDVMQNIVLDLVPDPALGQGQLTRNGIVLNNGDSILRSEIANGEIVYESVRASLGNIANIEFRSFDGTDFSNTANVQIEAEFSEQLLISTTGSQSFKRCKLGRRRCGCIWWKGFHVRFSNRW